MASKRYTLVFYVALIVAVAATFGVYRVIEATKAGNRIATTPVVVAARDMPEGAPIDRLAVSIAQWPSPTVPPGAFASVDSVTGRVTRVPVFKGEPIVPGRLAPLGVGPGLETRISAGKRAYSVRINEISGISGMIQPNSRVDMLVTLNTQGSEGRRIAKIFMENMRVLAVGSQVQRGDDGRPINAVSATLEVTPQQAEQIAIAQSQGQIQLVLRGYGDPAGVETKGATAADVGAALKSAPEYTAPQPRNRPAQRRVEAPAATVSAPAPAPVVTAPPPVVASKPDSAAIRIFRGNKATEEKVKKDTVKPPDRL